ncbi:MAG: hypothetical protein V4689_07455 [Verrucomicrobiota bacterium]
MKKLLISALLLSVGVISLIFSARIRVDLAAMKYDPTSQKLRGSYPPLIRSTANSDKSQTGLVTLSDGENVKFWFISHHVSDPGCTRFDFRDGTHKYMRGSYFCCEVQIPEDEVRTRQDLITFIEKHDES